MENEDSQKQTKTSSNQQLSSNNKKHKISSSIASKLIALIILIVIVIGAYFYLSYTTKSGAGAEAKAAAQGHNPKAPKVNVIKISAQSIPIAPSFLGHSEASKIVQIRARVQGFLQSRKFTEGTKVKKGAILYTIDPRQYKADLEQAKATLESGKAQLKYAQSQWDRYKKLLKEKAVTTAEVQNWESQANVARAKIAESKAKIIQAKLNLSYTKVTAPMSGMIGKSQMYEGAYLDASTNSLLATMWKVDPIYVSIEVNQDQLLKWRKLVKKMNGNTSLDKLPVSITLSDGSKYPHKGYVDFVDVKINSDTSTAKVRATVPNPDYTLKPGQFIHVTLMGVKKSDAVLVPQAAVLQNPASSAVYTVNSKNKIEVKKVELGNWHNKLWVVTSGLKPGEKVLVDHLMKVAPGMKVNPTVISTKDAVNLSNKQKAQD